MCYHEHTVEWKALAEELGEHEFGSASQPESDIESDPDEGPPEREPVPTQSD